MTLAASEAYNRSSSLVSVMEAAYRGLASLGGANGVIASTNGDPKVAPNWIAATLHEIECGATGVAVFPVVY